MIDHQTLVALACMISNKGAIDTTSLEAQLSSADKAQVQTIIASGACLPENLENLLKETQNKIDNGDVDDNPDSKPSQECC
jgi:hypothetical protein